MTPAEIEQSLARLENQLRHTAARHARAINHLKLRAAEAERRLRTLENQAPR